MHKIDGPGATGSNEWTEGNPSLSIPATTVTDDFMNTIQRELVEVVEAAGLTLNKPTDTQVRQAINILVQKGGSQVSQSIDNNQGTPTSVTGVVFDKASIKAAHMSFDVHRQTDSSNLQESGSIYLVHDSADDVWRIAKSSMLDDSGVDFSVVSGTGQLQYVSDRLGALAGANYSATLRITAIKEFDL